MLKQFKDTKSVAIINPEKNGNDATNYKTISLLCVSYTLLERIIYRRIAKHVDESLLIEQAGFRNNKVTMLTNYTETRYERKLKTGAFFIDLTSAYGTYE